MREYDSKETTKARSIVTPWENENENLKDISKKEKKKANLKDIKTEKRKI